MTTIPLTQNVSQKIIAIIALFTVFSVTSFSQEEKTLPPPITWGEIDKSNFESSVAEPFSESSTITLCKFGQSYVTDSYVDGVIRHTDYHVRFLVLSNDGIDRSNIKIRFWSGAKKARIERSNNNKFYGAELGEYVENIKGNVYNLDNNGIIVTSKLSDDQIFSVDISNMYSVGIVSLALPDVKVGSVVEYSYTISRRYSMQAEKWYFQSEYPCLHNEYRVSYPDKRSYALIATGLLRDSIDISESMLTFVNHGGRKDKVYRYLLQDVPALHDEPYVMSMDNFLTQLNIQISKYHNVQTQSNVEVISTWKLLAERLMLSDNFGRQMNRNGAIYNKLKDLYDPSLDSLTIIQNCYNHVRDHFHYNDSWSIYTRINLKDAYKSTVGSSVEINIILAGLLKKAGLKPKMALVSTRSHGVINVNYPFIKQFNHVICVVEVSGKKMFLDASSKEGTYNFPPAEIIGCKAFIVDKNNPEIVEVTTDQMYDKFVMCSGTLENDTLRGKLQFKYKGYAAAMERVDIDEYGNDYINELVDNNEDIELTNQRIVNLDDNDKPLLAQFDFTMVTSGFKNADMLYFNPFSAYGNFKSPFKSEKRTFPIEFNFPATYTYMYSYIIPDNYEIADVPIGINKASENNSVAALIYYNVVGKIVQIKTQFNFNRLIVPASEYQSVREIFSLWETKHDDVIVLRKKK